MCLGTTPMNMKLLKRYARKLARRDKDFCTENLTERKNARPSKANMYIKTLQQNFG